MCILNFNRYCQIVPFQKSCFKLYSHQLDLKMTIFLYSCPKSVLPKSKNCLPWIPIQIMDFIRVAKNELKIDFYLIS